MAYFDDIDLYFKKIVERMFREMAEFDEDVKNGKMQGEWNIRPIERPDVKGYVAQRQLRFSNEPNKSLTVPKEEMDEIREPLVDVLEDKDVVKLYVELPGVEKDDIQLSVVSGSAEIKAKNFSRQVALPTKDIEPDKTSANYKNGVLQVTIPKKAKAVSEEKQIIQIE